MQRMQGDYWASQAPGATEGLRARGGAKPDLRRHLGARLLPE